MLASNTLTGTIKRYLSSISMQSPLSRFIVKGVKKVCSAVNNKISNHLKRN